MIQTRHTRQDLERILAACENVPGYKARADAIRLQIELLKQKEATNG